MWTFCIVATWMTSYCFSVGISAEQHFVVKPSDMEVVEGDEVELPCQVANKVGAVQWSKDGFLLGFDSAIPGYPRHFMIIDERRGIYNLRIKNVHLEDDGEYQCQVGPGPGQNPIREVARIIVLVPPRSLYIEGYSDKSPVLVKPGEKLVLTCISLRSKPYVRLKWYRKNVELLPEASRITLEKPTPHLINTHSTIVLYPKNDDDGATYSCEATHPALKFTLRTSVRISIMVPPGPPEISGFDEDDLLHVGDALSLSCVSKKGNPLPRLFWYKDDVLIDQNFATTSANETINVHTFAVEASDNNAVYKCEAANSASIVPVYSTIQLRVMYPPSKLFISAPKEAKKGESVSLVCRSSPCNPSVKLSWAVDGMPVQDGKMSTQSTKEGWIAISTLNIFINRQDSDVKIFSCFAVSPLLQEPLSETTKIIVLYPPSPPTILGFEEGSFLQLGETIRLQCVTSGGNPAASLHWMKEEIELQTVVTTSERGVSSELVISAEPSDNNTTYRCQARSPALSKPSEATITLLVLFPPETVAIKVFPLEPRSGETISAECTTAPSNPAALITWWKDGTLLLDHEEEVVAGPYCSQVVSSRILLNVSAADDGKVLLCEARHALWTKTVRNDSWLSVFYKPEFIPDIVNVSIVEGEVWKVQLNLRANPPVKTLKWKKGDALVPVLAHDQPWKTDSPYRVLADGLILHLQLISRHDMGVYVCEADNEVGVSQARVFLTVLYPASVTSITKTVTATEGKDADMACFSNGNPLHPGHTKWRKNDFDTTRMKVSETTNGSVLTIFNVSRNDRGIFQCVAFNGLGEESVENATLIVHFKPTIVLSQVKSKVAASVGELAMLTCFAEGVPEVTFVWYAGASVISTEVNRDRFSQQSVNLRQELWRSVLSINDVTMDDYGPYSCVARNDLGFDAVKIELVVKSVPESPSGFVSPNATSNAVNLRWKAGFDGGLPQIFRIRYRPIHSQRSLFQDFSSVVKEAWLTNLHKDTEYYFSISAINELGESGHSEIYVSTQNTSTESKAKTSKGNRSHSMKVKTYNTIGGVVGTMASMISLIIVACICRRKYVNARRVAERAIVDIGRPETSSFVDENVVIRKEETEVPSTLYYIPKPTKSVDEIIELQDNQISCRNTCKS